MLKMIKKLKFWGKSQTEDRSFISRLCDEKSFFKYFIPDLKRAKKEVIIESPFITRQRMKTLMPIFKILINKKVKIYVITRDPKEHQKPYDWQSESEIRNFENIGVQTMICKGNHHRKLAIIDRKILWEGSLNILSQTNSREVMRRIDSPFFAQEMFDFLNLKKFI